MSVMSERHSQLEKRTNEHGFPQMYLVEEGQENIAVCAQCTCYVMPNRGQGMICDTCHTDIMIECTHDYDEGNL